jgi:hypothetical protein
MDMNITKLVEKYISEHPSVKDCLRKRLINYSSLSRLLLKELNLDKTKFDAILIASRRYYEKLKRLKSEEERILSILRNSKLEIKNKILVAVVEKSHIYPLIIELEKKVRKKSEPFYVLEGTTAVTIVTSADFLSEIKNTFGSRILKLNQNLALVTIKSPKALEITPGVLAVLASALADRNINIVENMSCWTDTLFVVAEKDVAAVIEAMKF